MNLLKRFAIVCFLLLQLVVVTTPASAQLVVDPPPVRDPTFTWVDRSRPGVRLRHVSHVDSISGSVMNWKVTFRYWGLRGYVRAFPSSNATITSNWTGGVLSHGQLVTVEGTAPASASAGNVYVEFRGLRWRRGRSRASWTWNAAVNPDPVVTPWPPVDCPEEECGKKGFHGRAIAGKSILCPPNRLMRSFGRKTDLSVSRVAGASGCQSCGGGSLASANDENLLDVSRKFVSSNQASIGNCSPGVYFNFDYRVEFYQDYGGKNVAILFDPESEKTFYYEYESASSSYVCKIDINGTTQDFDSYFGNITLENCTCLPGQKLIWT